MHLSACCLHWQHALRAARETVVEIALGVRDCRGARQARKHQLGAKVPKSRYERCYAKCVSKCDRGMSGEHYISKAVLLRLFPDGMCDVKGLRWQEKSGREGTVSVNDLQSNILCRHHNSLLNYLDDAALELFNFFDAVGAKVADRSDKSPTINATLCGESIERWMAKVLCGLSESKSISSLSGGLPGRLSDNAIKHMFGEGETPFTLSMGYGFYKFPPHSALMSDRALEFITWYTPDGKMFAFEMQLHGMRFVLIFGSFPGGFAYAAWYKPPTIEMSSSDDGRVAGILNLTWEPDPNASPLSRLFDKSIHPATVKPIWAENASPSDSLNPALGRVQVVARAKPFQSS